DAVGAVILVQVENDLAVAPRSKHVPSLHEAGPELGEVVDLTVDDDPDGLVFIEERLGAFGRQVDDRETPVTQHRAGAAPEASGVGPAVLERVVHSPDGHLVVGGVMRGVRDSLRDDARDAAHGGWAHAYHGVVAVAWDVGDVRRGVIRSRLVAVRRRPPATLSPAVPLPTPAGARPAPPLDPY